MTVTILRGDCIEMMRTLPSDSVDCCVSSPPYWGLRDYGVAGQLGMEPTLGEHLEAMVNVCAEIHRVLKPSGTLWLNYGDCYATTPNGRSAADTKAAGGDDRTFRDKPFSTIGPIYDPTPSGAGGSFASERPGYSGDRGRIRAGGSLKAKDLCMIPNRLAIELQAWGWWVRSEIIWAKPNPMPESVHDRPATAHEKIFLLTKEGRYSYNADAVRRPAAESSCARWDQNIENQEGSARANGGSKTNGKMKAVGGPKKDKQRGHSRRREGFNDRWDGMSKEEQQANGRNLRNYEPAPVEVWEIATHPFKQAHFATFPPALVQRCLLAGCPPGGLVLDPFGGAGTTGLVADRMGMDAILIELNPEYIDIAETRIRSDNPMFAQVITPQAPNPPEGV